MIKFRYFVFIIFVCVVIFFAFIYISKKYEIIEVNPIHNEESVFFDQRNIYYWKIDLEDFFIEFIGFWVVIDDSFMVKNESGWIEKIVVHPINTSVFKKDLEVLSVSDFGGLGLRKINNFGNQGITIYDKKDYSQVDFLRPVFIVISSINKGGSLPESLKSSDYVKKRYEEIKNERLSFYNILNKKLTLTKIGKVAILVEIKQ